MKRFHHAEFVRDFREVLKGFRETDPALPMLGEREDGPGSRKRGLTSRHAGEALSVENRIGDLLAVNFVEMRFVVEEINLWWAP